MRPCTSPTKLGAVFARVDCQPHWRERLVDVGVPTLVVHGRRDPFFPIGNGEAIARAVPSARLLVIQDMSTAIPTWAVAEIADAMAAGPTG